MFERVAGDWRLYPVMSKHDPRFIRLPIGSVWESSTSAAEVYHGQFTVNAVTRCKEKKHLYDRYFMCRAMKPKMFS